MTHSNIPAFDFGIHGGALAGVSAALELKRRGFSVWLSTHRTYLGEDLCDPLRLMLPPDLDAADPVLQRLFPDAVRAAGHFRPMALKRELDRLLAEAGIPVYMSSAPGEIFVDGAGAVRGLSLCDRSGRRVLACRALLDATVAGDLLRLAGVPLTAPARKVGVIRRIIGGEAPGQDCWREEGRVKLEAREERLWAFHAERPLGGPGWSDWMDLEQRVRMEAHRPGQTYSADGIEAFSGERLQPGTAPVDAGADALPAGACTALDGHLWVLGGGANMAPSRRERLKRPDTAWHWGRILAGRLAQAAPDAARDHGWHSLSSQQLPAGIRQADLALPGGALPQGADSLHAVERFDVLVVGGGTGGAPAAIAAARSGASTLVAEFLSGLGGVGTLGLIGRYWFGVQEGFTAEIDAGADALTTRQIENGWDVEAKMQWYHQEITRAGGHIWYKTMVAGALREQDRVAGAVLCTPRGRIAVLARCTVDATGAAEVAAAAGARTVPVGDGHLAMQGTGLPARNPGRDYTNTDYDFIDDSNAEDAASAHVTAREKFKDAFDAGQLVDSRERRRIVGEIEVSPMDIRLSRVFPDTICRARSNFDTHGFTVHPLFLIVDPGHDPVNAHIPLRALLPAGLESILVTGLGISAHRDAMPVIRMQADVQNQGYAAGLIAAMAPDGRIRALDPVAIQSPLIEKGILTPELLQPPDSFPLPESDIDAAVRDSVGRPDLLDRVFTLPPQQRNARLRRAFAEAQDETARRHFAFALGVVGDPTGAECLAAEVAATPWDTGWDYRGMGQFGASMSPLDARIIALSRCRVSATLPVLLAKAESLPDEAAFSHYRALAEALATMGDATAAPALATLLARPGIRGHAVTDIKARLATAATADATETAFRNRALIEISLAAALFALQPESELAGAVLHEYARDVRGLFARHARSTLQGHTGS
jgi:hypothetical protein